MVLESAQSIRSKDMDMDKYLEGYEELVRMESEELSEALFGALYSDLSLELRLWLRAQAIAALWPEEVPQVSIAAA